MTIVRFCPAKINLFLEVQGKRSDGYHEIVTVMVPIDFGDTLTVRRSRGLRLRVEGAAPIRDNLVLRAYDALDLRRGADFVLQKRVPIGSGLGGGSSDAAAALLALNKLYDLRLSREELHLAAAKVGSDVPFFLYGQPALCTGRGEVVTPLPPRTMHFELRLPPFGISTAAVYSRVSPSPVRSVHDFFRTWKPFNRLEEPALRVCPDLKEWLRPPWRMSGSGSTLYRVCPRRPGAGSLAASTLIR